MCPGINRHEGEDERVLRERSSEPLGPEFAPRPVRGDAKHKQGIGGLGIELRKDSIRMLTPYTVCGKRHGRVSHGRNLVAE